MKDIFVVFASLFFGFAAVVQYNDPDGWLWAPFYALTVALGLFVAFAPATFSAKRFSLSAHLVMTLGLALWVFTHTEDAFNPGGSQELYHEAGGLGLVLVWNLVLVYLHKLKQK